MKEQAKLQSIRRHISLVGFQALTYKSVMLSSCTHGGILVATDVIMSDNRMDNVLPTTVHHASTSPFVSFVSMKARPPLLGHARCGALQPEPLPLCILPLNFHSYASCCCTLREHLFTANRSPKYALKAQQSNAIVLESDAQNIMLLE